MALFPGRLLFRFLSFDFSRRTVHPGANRLRLRRAAHLAPNLPPALYPPLNLSRRAPRSSPLKVRVLICALGAGHFPAQLFGVLF